jgi:tetratricopeptide (TPR) repeat protein
MRRVSHWIVLLAFAATAAAALDESALSTAIRQRGLDPEAVLSPLRLSDEMRSWLRAEVPLDLPASERIVRLLEGLLRDRGLGLRYEAGFTGTAEEVFTSRVANCLGFTQLFVAMGRELDVEVYYLGVDRLTSYRRESDLIIVSDHVTAAFEEGAQRRVLEFALGPRFDYRSARRVDDLVALGLYYSNRGAELVQQQRYREAVAQLDVAVVLAPELAQAWANRGVARRRVGDFDGAEADYQRAIEANPDQLSAYHNLAGLYLLLGRRDPVGEILTILERRNNRNPFVFLLLGDLSLGQGEMEDAGRFYRRALRLGREHAETHAAYGLWRLATGDRQRAARALTRAERRDREEQRTRKLRSSLSAGAAGDSAS